MTRHDRLSTTPTWHLASYPCSGTHLVRTLIDYAAHRPTLGGARAQGGLIRICDADATAFRSHIANQLQRHDHDYLIDNFLLVTRDPREAISSHLARDMGRRLYTSDRQLRITVERELDAYLAVLHAYRAYPTSKRLHVSFERLTGTEGPSYAAARAVLRAMGLPDAALSEADWLRLREVAAARQSSLGRRDRRVRERLRRAVAERIDRAEVERFVARGSWAA